MKKLLSLGLVLLSFFTIATAQTATLTLVTAPCSNNGVLQATSTGLSLPVTYYFFVAGTTISNTTGTLTSYAGGPVNVTAVSGSAYATASFAGAPPFTFTITSTAGVCPVLATATATVTGGTAPYAFQWTPQGSTTVAATGNPVSLPGNTGYELLITDAAGCTYGSVAKKDSIYISNVSPVNFSISSTVASCTNGTATIGGISGGVSPYSYTWSTAAHTASITGLVRGFYTATVTDANGCASNRSVNIAQTPAIPVSFTVVNATCLNTNGSATAFGSGGLPPYTYLWSNLQTTQNATGLTGSTSYSVVVTDANGCSGTGSRYILSSTPITATVSATASSCTAATGTATVAYSGGTAPYSVSWNTFPAQTGNTATGLAPGVYSFTVTDAVGCVRTGAATVPPVSAINAIVSSTNATCTALNGSATVLATGTATPFSYSWSGGATTATASSLAAGYYSVVVTDNNGCKVTKSVRVGTSSPVSIGLSVTPASCIYNSDGAATATASGGSTPYTYNWGGSTGGTLTGKPTGQYYVAVTDAAGCTASSYVYIGYNAANSSCYCTITGTVYKDVNSNCVKDPAEAGIPNVMIHCSGRGYTFTNAAGVYSFRVPSGTYTMSQTVQAYYPLASCQSNAVVVTTTAGTGCVNTVNFADSTATIHDMSIHATSLSGPPIPGNNYYQMVIVKNEGTVTESGILTGYKHDGQLGTPSVSSLWTAAGSNSYRNNGGFSTLAPAISQSFLLGYSVPTNIPLYTSLVFLDSTANTSPMSNWLTDYTPWNNVNAYYSAVAGSFDPNNKEVSPKGQGQQGFIAPEDSVLSYTIHFQNTGNYPAQKVVLMDTLSPNLDWNTLKPIASSHSFVTDMTDGGGIVTFSFNNINLPDSLSNPLGSMGYIMYSVRQKPLLADGTKIENNASIYFDYNAPVKTNTTLNTLKYVLGVKPVKSYGLLEASAYPNPARDKVNILVQSEGAKSHASIRFVSLVGQTMQQQEVTLVNGRNVFEASTANLAAGMYFIEITDGSKLGIIKLSVVR